MAVNFAVMPLVSKAYVLWNSAIDRGNMATQTDAEGVHGHLVSTHR